MRGADSVEGIDDAVIFPTQHGKTLVFLGKEALEAAQANADFIFSYDGTVATLARSFDINVLPYDATVRSEPS